MAGEAKKAAKTAAKKGAGKKGAGKRAKRAPPRPKGWQKEEVIAAAAQCFMERGFHVTTVDDVARRLGCTKGRIYHHYASKTDLFFDVHREGMRRLFDAIAPAVSAAGRARTGLEGLVMLLLAHAEAMLEHHVYESVVAQGVQVHRFDAVTPDQRGTMRALIASRDDFEDLFKHQIRAAIADGSMRAMDVSVTSKILLGGLQWSIYWYRPRAGETAEDRARLAHRMVEPLVGGLIGERGTEM